MTDFANCICARIKVGGVPTTARNWNPDCPEHGVGTDWYESDEQQLRRAEQDRNLRDLQRRAREARQAARLQP
jgi:hypothetical protein